MSQVLQFNLVDVVEEGTFPMRRVKYKGVTLNPSWQFSFGVGDYSRDICKKLVLLIESVDPEISNWDSFEFDIPFEGSDFPKDLVVPLYKLVSGDGDIGMAIINAIMYITQEIQVTLSERGDEVHVTVVTSRKNFNLVIPWETAREFFDLV
jgi:hypothetical protein